MDFNPISLEDPSDTKCLQDRCIVRHHGLMLDRFMHAEFQSCVPCGFERISGADHLCAANKGSGGAGTAGATRASYAMPSTSTADDGHVFRCVVTNEAGSITSDASKLSVNIITEEEKAKLEAMKPEVDKILEEALGSSNPAFLSENVSSPDKIDGINNQVSHLLKGQFGDGYKKFYCTMPLSISSSKDNVGNVSEKSLSKVNGISTPSSASYIGNYSEQFYYFDSAYPDSSGGVKHRLVQYMLNCSFQLNATPWFAYHTASQNVVLYIVEYYVSSSGVPSLISNTVDTAWAPYISSLGLCDEVQQSAKQLNWCPGAKITVTGSIKWGWFPQMWGGLTNHWIPKSMYNDASLDRTIRWCGVTPSAQ